MSDRPVTPPSERAQSTVEADSDASGSLMQIGEVATRTELSLRSLRHWEEVGLLKPSGRSDGGFRLYSEADVDKILVIRRMKPLGFSLDQMKAVMADLDALDDSSAHQATREMAQNRLDRIQEDALERRAALARQLAMADEFILLLDPRRGSST